MMKNKKLERLKTLYLLVFILGAIIIAPTHIFPQPYFMHARFPHYLETMPAFLGISWPVTFEIYHYVLYALIIIVSFNALGIIFYSKFKRAAIISSAIGLFLISLMTLFFFFTFIRINFPNAIIYGSYSVVLLIVDWFTFKALTIRRTRV